MCAKMFKVKIPTITLVWWIIQPHQDIVVQYFRNINYLCRYSTGFISYCVVRLIYSCSAGSLVYSKAPPLCFVKMEELKQSLKSITSPVQLTNVSISQNSIHCTKHHSVSKLGPYCERGEQYKHVSFPTGTLNRCRPVCAAEIKKENTSVILSYGTFVTIYMTVLHLSLCNQHFINFTQINLEISSLLRK